MNWIRLALTVFAGGFVASLTDWLFMGDWLYKRYDQYPEIWRHPHGQGEMKAIAWYTPLPFVTCAVFAVLCARLNLHSYSATVKLALAIWLVGPLPLTHRQCAVHQTALRNYCVLFPRMAGETGGSSRGCDPDSALSCRNVPTAPNVISYPGSALAPESRSSGKSLTLIGYYATRLCQPGDFGRRIRARPQTVADDGPCEDMRGACARFSTSDRALREERTRPPNYRSGLEECEVSPCRMQTRQVAYHLGAGPSLAVS